MIDITNFKALGYSDNEVAVYLHLLEHGAVSAYALAKHLHLPRSTAYSVLEALESKRLVRRSARDGGPAFCAEPPSQLVARFSEEQERAQKRLDLASNLAQELAPLLQSHEHELPKIEFFEGKANVERFLYDNLLKWRDSILRCDSCSWGYQDHTFVEEFSAWIKKAWVVYHQQAGISGKILSNRSSIEQSLRGRIPRREVRVLSKAIPFESTIWVMGCYVVVIMTRKRPMYAFHIHEPLLAANLRTLFENLYQQAEQLGR